MPKIDFLPFPKQGTPLEGEGLIGSGFAPPLAGHVGNDFYREAIWICPFLSDLPVGVAPSSRPHSRSDRPLDFTSSASSLISRGGGKPRGAKTFFIFFSQNLSDLSIRDIWGFSAELPKIDFLSFPVLVQALRGS